MDTRTRIRDCLGSFPDECAPDVETLSVDAADGFERRLVEYDVEPGERISAYLLVPHGSERERPGVLAVHPHGGEYAVGKSDPAGLSDTPEYHYGAALCRRGHVVLCPDLLCFEDRRPTSDDGDAALTGGEYERFVAMDYLLRGSTLQAKYLSDLSVALDVLAGHDRVDGDSLGAIGHSMGGQETLWLSWYDDRLSAAVSSCGAARLAAIQRERINHNFALYVPGLLAAGDMEDVLAGAAPTPLLAINGDEDAIFPADSVRTMVGRAADAYGDGSNRFEALTFSGGHEFPANVRDRAYDWFDRWLDG